MLKTIRSGDLLTVQLRGELDHCSAQGVRREIDGYLMDHGIRHLLLDLSALTLMDSSGIGVILGRYRILRERGGSVAVRGMNSHIARIFRMSGLERVICIIDRKEAAQ